jgi:hypothetical protein
MDRQDLAARVRAAVFECLVVIIVVLLGAYGAFACFGPDVARVTATFHAR